MLFPRRLVAWPLFLVAISSSLPALAENWPQWRGPRQNGVSEETGLPHEFDTAKNVAWKVPLPGPSGATPVVWGDRIFVSSVGSNNSDLLLLCVSTDGKVLWERRVSSGNRAIRGDEGNYASNSPSTDGQHVWAMVGDGTLACFDFEGNQKWKVNLQERYGRFNIQYGMSSTPVLDGDRLYLQLIHGDGRAQTREAVVAALDKKTGDEIWKVGRPSDAYAENEHSYASPIVYRDDKQEFLLTHGADFVVAHKLHDGSEIWRCGGLNPKGRYNPTLRLVATPAAVPGLIVVPSAKNGPVLALKPEALAGNVTDKSDALAWSLPSNTPDVPSPLIHDGLVYLCRENGNLICLDAKTGERLYEKLTHRQRHRASPVYADGKVYLCARDGVINVVKAGREFELLATNKLEPLSASPAISGGTIYFRTEHNLFAIRSASDK
jgi:outer membrane protein assembly factor BamB